MADEQAVVEMTEQEVEQAGNTPTEQAQVKDGSNDMTELRAQLERTKRLLDVANTEAAQRRTKLEEFERREQERRDAELSETERLKKQLADAKAAQEQLVAKMAETQVRAAVERAAAQMRFYDPADAYALADLSAVTTGEDGKIDGVDKALKDLAKAKPHLVRTEQPANLNANNRTNGAAALSDDQAQELAAIYGVRPESIKKASNK